MKKRSKRLLTTITVLIALLVAVVFIIRKTDVGGVGLVHLQAKDINNNTIVFTSDSFHDYVHVMLKTTENKNIENPLEFDVINPKGEKVISGQLHENEVFKHTFKKMKGEWKVVLHYKNNDSSSMIDFGYRISFKKENGLWSE